ncbi:hypothetical protein [Niameybacter massiliensis]|uniref:hypothetical protein n=1 Tax=Niameybacter massiliensis TaxID=1658108 RepID=UPI0006B6158E|nr:hypothetical protein [Niameybacter massiliensis]
MAVINNVVFKMILSDAEITGDNAGKEPGSFSTIIAQVSGNDLSITANQEAYFYIPVNYTIGTQTYTQLSWKILGPAIIATQSGVTYTVADFIMFQSIPTKLSGSIYINTMV